MLSKLFRFGSLVLVKVNFQRKFFLLRSCSGTLDLSKTHLRILNFNFMTVKFRVKNRQNFFKTLIFGLLTTAIDAAWRGLYVNLVFKFELATQKKSYSIFNVLGSLVWSWAIISKRNRVSETVTKILPIFLPESRLVRSPSPGLKSSI